MVVKDDKVALLHKNKILNLQRPKSNISRNGKLTLNYDAQYNDDIYIGHSNKRTFDNIDKVFL